MRGLTAETSGQATIKEAGERASRAASAVVDVKLLLRNPPDFTGRQPQLEQIVAALRSAEGQEGISALRGMGGIGKTILAERVAYELRGDYPDGRVLVELKGTEREPPRPAAAMRAILEFLQHDVRVSDDEGQLAAEYQKTLSGRQMLLVLDNACDAAQVEPLIPPPPCGTLVTSRRAIALPGMRSVALDVLPLPEAIELLRKIVGDRSDASANHLNDLAARCGRLPLALCVAARFLAKRSNWTVAEYVDELRSERLLSRLKDERDDVEAVLALSARQLLEEDRGLAARWRMLTVFPGDFDRAGAAAVWAVEEVVARDALGNLLELSLLQFDETSRRYRFHDLVRPVAQDVFDFGTAERDEAWEAETLNSAFLRHAAHFCEVLRDVEVQYMAGEVLDGLERYDLEEVNIRAGREWAAARWGDDHAVAELVVGYVLGGINTIELRLHARERIHWLTDALLVSRAMNDRQKETSVLNDLANAYADLGEPQTAIEHYEQSLEIRREVGDRHGEGRTLGNLGATYATLGHPQQAVAYYDESLEICCEVGDRRAAGNALNNLGLAYAALGDPRKAIEYYERALATKREVGDRYGERETHWNLGLACSQLDHREEAEQHFRASLVIAEELDHHELADGRAWFEQWLADGGSGSSTGG